MSQSNYKSRLAALRARRQSGAGTFSAGLTGGEYATPLRGVGRRVTIQPIVFGDEIALVQNSSALCLGKIGQGGTVCLKVDVMCNTETHSKKKGNLPEGPSLIQLKGEDKGYENVVLEVGDLEKSLIDDLLNRHEVNWPVEFSKIKSNDTKTVEDLEIVEDVLNTARKHRTFKSPAKIKVNEDILDRIGLLDTSQNLVMDMLELNLNESGEGTEKDFTFDEVNYVKTCSDLHDKVEVLAENSKCLNDVIMDLQPFIHSHTKPIEHLLSGLRTEMATFQSQLGIKDLEKRSIPPCIWNAVESGFESIGELEEKFTKLNLLASEAHEISSFLLDSAEEIDTKPSKPPMKMDSDAYLNGLSTGTKMVDGNIVRPTTPFGRGRPAGRDGDNGHTPPHNSDPSNHGADCNYDDILCGRCMVKIQSLDNRLTSTNVRLSNLEDAKSGNIDSALMVKNQVYRGRADVAAELDKWFPASSGKKIDAGLFPTPHLILNLMHADICSKKAPKIPLDQKDLIKLEIRRSDADAFYALQSDKPEFMITNELCPNFSYKASKTIRDSAAIRFLPSHEDFGNGLDSDSLHFKFKSSLEHIKGERERYIESRLSDHPDHRVISIAKQTLDDSCKFISQMLAFMDEIYAACFDSFGATSEAWDLVCHCIEEVFTKELKPCLKHCVAQDLVDVQDALIGVVHTSFSLNCKIRELTSVGLKNHHSTTTSHVRFVMKMAKSTRKADQKSKGSQEKTTSDTKMSSTISLLERENSDLKSHVKRVESRLDSFRSQVKSYLGVTEDELSKPKKKSSGAKKESEKKE